MQPKSVTFYQKRNNKMQPAKIGKLNDKIKTSFFVKIKTKFPTLGPLISRDRISQQQSNKLFSIYLNFCDHHSVSRAPYLFTVFASEMFGGSSTLCRTNEL